MITDNIMTQIKRLIIIDGHAVLHRAFHALPPLTTQKGEQVNAIYGFLLVFFKALNEFRPDFAVATFDLPAPTFRHQEFKEYKAKRPKMADELAEQIPKIKNILTAFSVPIFEKEGFEADDLIGALSRQAEQEQVETVIISGDLDVLQLVGPATKVFALRKGVKDTVLYDEEKVKEKYDGLLPSQLLDYKALRGDPSDNIPGAAGIGEKTALTLIKDFDNIENIYETIEQQSDGAEKITPAVKEKLTASKEQVFLSKRLVAIRKDAPVDLNLEQCRWGDYDFEKAEKALGDFEFYSLIKKIPAPMAIGAERAKQEEEKPKPSNLKLF